MMNDSSVFLELDGETVELVATLDALSVISRTFGGVGVVHDKVRNLDFDAMCVVVRAGLMVDGDAAKEIPAKIYRTGLVKAMPKISEFVLLVATGGVKSKGDDQESETPGKP